jgi:L-fuculose-phosphate aldolase
MNKENLSKKLSQLALSMFRKDFLGLYHGSISAKTESNRFIINSKEAVFDSLDENSFVELHFTKDYRWNQASIDADIHFGIYSQFSDAKFIAFTMPPFITAYSLKHNLIIPKDYFGYKEFKTIEIFDPKEFENWYDRAQSEITHYFQTKKTNIIVIRGYGVYSFNRDIHEIVKKLSILEHSCKLLLLNEHASKL